RDDIDDINSSDIESLQILKDTASTSIYGSRGSIGVVLIVLKSGRYMKPQISYSYDLSSSEQGRTYDLLSARDYIYYQRLGIYAFGQYNPVILGGLNTPSSGGIGNDLTKNTAFTTQYLTPENQYKLNEGWESMPDPVNPDKTI